MRIAFIGARGLVGTYSGIETYYDEVGSRLVERGHEVTAYCRRHFTPDISSYHGIQVRRLPALRSKHLETLSHSVLATLDSLGREFDIVQFHAIGSAFLALIPRLAGRTTVVSVRGLDWQRAKWNRMARTALQLGEWASARVPHATVVVSETLADHYEAKYGKRPTVIRNAIQQAEEEPFREIHEFGLQENEYILYAGRISPEKGVHTLIEAMQPLCGKKQLAIAGGSSYSDDYIEEVRRQAGDGVVFLGSLDHGSVQELFRKCYAYVLPSAMEGLSIALLEALSHGACIVTTHIPENLEVVGDAALTFTPGDSQQLGRHLEHLVADPDAVAELRLKARERARLLSDWDEVAARTEALYVQLLNASNNEELSR